MADIEDLKLDLKQCPEQIQDYVKQLEQQNVQYYNRLHSADAQLQLYAGEVYRLRGERQLLIKRLTDLWDKAKTHYPTRLRLEEDKHNSELLGYIKDADANAEETAKAVQEDVDAEQ